MTVIEMAWNEQAKVRELQREVQQAIEATWTKPISQEELAKLGAACREKRNRLQDLAVELAHKYKLKEDENDASFMFSDDGTFICGQLK